MEPYTYAERARKDGPMDSDTITRLRLLLQADLTRLYAAVEELRATTEAYKAQVADGQAETVRIRTGEELVEISMRAGYASLLSRLVRVQGAILTERG